MISILLLWKHHDWQLAGSTHDWSSARIDGTLIPQVCPLATDALIGSVHIRDILLSFLYRGRTWRHIIDLYIQSIHNLWVLFDLFFCNVAEYFQISVISLAVRICFEPMASKITPKSNKLYLFLLFTTKQIQKCLYLPSRLLTSHLTI